MILTDEDFTRSLGILHEAEINMKYVFYGVGEHSDAAVLSRIMAMIAERKVVSKSELLSNFIFDTTNDSLSRMLLSLETTDFCDLVFDDGKCIVQYKEGR